MLALRGRWSAVFVCMLLASRLHPVLYIHCHASSDSLSTDGVGLDQVRLRQGQAGGTFSSIACFPSHLRFGLGADIRLCCCAAQEAGDDNYADATNLNYGGYKLNGAFRYLPPTHRVRVDLCLCHVLRLILDPNTHCLRVLLCYALRACVRACSFHTKAPSADVSVCILARSLAASRSTARRTAPICTPRTSSWPSAPSTPLAPTATLRSRPHASCAATSRSVPLLFPSRCSTCFAKPVFDLVEALRS